MNPHLQPDSSATSSPERVVRRVRRALVGTLVGSAVLWGAAAATLARASSVRLAIALVVGAVVVGVVMWLDRAVLSRDRVALWIEERHPELRFALVTAIGRHTAASPPDGGVDHLLSRAVAAVPIDVRRLVTRAVLRRLAPAAIGAGVASVLAAAVPMHLDWQRFTRVPSARSLSDVPGSGDRLASFTVTILPPAYSRLATRELAQPTEVSALVGSRIVVHGRGSTRGLEASVGTLSVPVVDTGGGWQIILGMPRQPAIVRLGDRDAAGRRDAPGQRVIALVPIADAAPLVELTSPIRDSVLRTATGTLALRAHAADDFGVDDAVFEVIVTAGDEDEGGVHGRTLAVGARAFADARSADLDGNLNLDALALTPGAVVSIRAVARDGNTVSGPGIGSSETRTFRLVRRDELDTAVVESAAPSIADSSILSEQVVIIGTEALLARTRKAPPLSADSVGAASQRLANQQATVRAGVSGVLLASDGMALPIGDVLTAPERTLLDSASYLMGDATAALATHAPRRALPIERAVLALLDSARSLAHRLYLRSRPARMLVNVAQVRLTGADHPDPAVRPAALPSVEDSTVWVSRIDGVHRLLVAGLPLARAAALDSLTVLRVDVLPTHPRLAAALEDAITQMRTGRDPSPALARCRALLVGATLAVPGLRPGTFAP